MAKPCSLRGWDRLLRRRLILAPVVDVDNFPIAAHAGLLIGLIGRIRNLFIVPSPLAKSALPGLGGARNQDRKRSADEGFFDHIVSRRGIRTFFEAVRFDQLGCVLEHRRRAANHDTVAFRR